MAALHILLLIIPSAELGHEIFEISSSGQCGDGPALAELGGNVDINVGIRVCFDVRSGSFSRERRKRSGDHVQQFDAGIAKC